MNPGHGPATAAASCAPGSVPTRGEVPERYLWDLSDLYASPDAWHADVARASELIDQLRAAQDSLDSAEALANTFALRDDAGILIERIAAYASLRRDEDTNDKSAQANFSIATDLCHRYSEAISWLAPSLLAKPPDLVAGWIDASPALGIYRHWWNDLQRQREHVRGPAEEQLLAAAGQVTDGPGHAFTLFANADLKFGTIRDEDGQEVQLTNGRYSGAIYSTDRRYRRDAFYGLHEGYSRYANTLASLLSSRIKGDIFYARSRNYRSAREAALEPNNIPLRVYDNLVETINRHLPLLHRYTEIRKRILKLDELHPYDLYVSLVPESRDRIDYDDAVQTIIEALGVLGADYVDPMRKGFESRWIDVFETRSKRSGAYCQGTYSVHPYLLLNYESTANARSTVAHEMGHAMHTWFTQHHQPPVYGDYTIFCAEVASTVNEVLLAQHLLRRATSDTERLRLINASLESCRTTVFRQTMFAEFEQITHEMAERGEPLTSEALFRQYRRLYAMYYGPALTLDDVLDAECLRIPHFYRNFYVYQYATSYCAATNIARRILAGESGAVAGLLRFLKAGSSDYSINILKLAGVDMTTARPFEDTMLLFSEQLDEMERLLVSPAHAR